MAVERSYDTGSLLCQLPGRLLGRSSENVPSRELHRGASERILTPRSPEPTQAGTTPSLTFRAILSGDHVDLDVSLEPRTLVHTGRGDHFPQRRVVLCPRTCLGLLLSSSRKIKHVRAALTEHAAPLRRGYTALVKIYLFQKATTALGHARQRLLSDMHRHTRLLAQPLVEMPEQGPATSEDHPPVHDVRT